MLLLPGDYVTKNPQLPLEMLSLVQAAKAYTSTHVSTAEDAGTPDRSFKFLLERALNKLSAGREISATSAAAFLLGYARRFLQEATTHKHRMNESKKSANCMRACADTQLRLAATAFGPLTSTQQ